MLYEKSTGSEGPGGIGQDLYWGMDSQETKRCAMVNGYVWGPCKRVLMNHEDHEGHEEKQKRDRSLLR